MRPDLMEAFIAAINVESSHGSLRYKSDVLIKREATLLAKQVELFIENLEDQDMTLRELYGEIAGQGHYGS